MAVKIMINNQALIQALRGAEKHCQHMGPARQQIGNDLVVAFQKNFDAEGRPEKWKPLKESTMVRKLRRFKGTYTKKGKLSAKGKRIQKGSKILMDSSRLRNSIVYQVLTNGVQIGTNVVYAATHQFGRDAIPARPFLVIQEEDEIRMAQTIEDHTTRELK
jgi:phage virion morphogenesis protein